MFKASCRAGGAPSREEGGGHDPQRLYAQPLSKRSPPPGGFTLHVGSRAGVNRREMAEDGEIESQRFRAHPVSGRGQPPGWFILQEQKVQ